MDMRAERNLRSRMWAATRASRARVLQRRGTPKRWGDKADQ